MDIQQQFDILSDTDNDLLDSDAGPGHHTAALATAPSRSARGQLLQAHTAKVTLQPATTRPESITTSEIQSAPFF